LVEAGHDLPLGERGQGGELVDDQEDVRRVAGGVVKAAAAPGQLLCAFVLDLDEFFDELTHQLRIGVGEAGEQGSSGAQLHSALGVDGPDLDRPGSDPRGKSPQ